MTDREEKKLRELQAKKRKEQRDKKKWKDEIVKNKDEIFKVLKIEDYDAIKQERDELRDDMDKLQEIADDYGCSMNDLFNWIRSPRQVEYYKKQKSSEHRTAQVPPTDHPIDL